MLSETLVPRVSPKLCHAHQRSDCHAAGLLVAYHRPLSHLTARLLSLSPQRDKIPRNRTPHWSTVLTPPAVEQVRANGCTFLINFNTTLNQAIQTNSHSFHLHVVLQPQTRNYTPQILEESNESFVARNYTHCVNGSSTVKSQTTLILHAKRQSCS